MRIKTTQKLTPVPVEEHRGRTAYTVELLGQPILESGKAIGVMTENFVGQDPKDLQALAASRGLDLAQVLAEGMNALAREAASRPGLERHLLASGASTDRKEARILAMHLRKVAKSFNQKPEDLVKALSEARAS